MEQTTRKIEFINDTYDWQSLSLWEYLQEGNIPKGWESFFTRDDVQKDLRNISDFLVLQREYTVYPLINHVFRAFIPLEKIKFVVLGQDPYFNGSAVGLCFSVKKGNTVNPSLKNIYREMRNCGYYRPENGDLFHWRNQGGFLLNTALTVEEARAGSHISIWYEFTEKVIKHLAENRRDVVWLLMGSKAHAYLEFIDQKRHKVFMTSHPSPLGAYKSLGGGEIPAFIGSHIFKDINAYLGKEKEIEW